MFGLTFKQEHQRRRDISILGWVITVLVIFISYLALATNGYFKFQDEPPIGGSFYGQLAQGFISGHLSLPTAPSSQLLELSNPYDPKARRNIPFLWDTSLFKGKYYLYFGPVPVLIFYIPYRFITGSYPSYNFAMFCFSLAAIVLITATIIRIIRSTTIQNITVAPQLIALLTAFGCSFSLVVGNGIYGCAIICAAFFLSVLIFFSIKIILDGITVKSALWIGIASVSAIGCRPAFVSYVIVLPLWVVLCRKSLSKRDLFNLAMGYLPPIFIGFLALLLYNFLRFESITEFGTSYQLGLSDFQNSGFFSSNIEYLLKNAPLQAWYMLFSPVTISPEFPYLYFYRTDCPLFIPAPNYIMMKERAVGVFSCCLILVPGIIAFCENKDNLPFGVKKFLQALIYSSFLSLLLVLCMRSAAGRYVIDFHIPWFICATVGLCLWNNSTKDKRRFNVRKIIIILSTALTIIIGFLAIFQGYKDNPIY